MSDESLDDFDAEEETPEIEDKGKENAVIRELRAQYKAKDKAATAAEKRAEALETKVAEYSARERTATLTAAGFSEKQMNAFEKTYGEPTQENIAEFRTEVLGLKQSSEDQGELEEQAPHRDFVPVQVGTSSSPGKKVYTPAEWNQLSESNPAEAQKAQQEGRILRESVKYGSAPAF